MLLLQTRSNTHICRSTHRAGPATSNHVAIADCNSPPGLSMKFARRPRRLELYCQYNAVHCSSFKPTGPHHLEFHCQCNSIQCCQSSFESLAISDCITDAVVIKDYRWDSSGLTVSSCVAVVLVLSDYSFPSIDQGCKASPSQDTVPWDWCRDHLDLCPEAYNTSHLCCQKTSHSQTQSLQYKPNILRKPNPQKPAQSCPTSSAPTRTSSSPPKQQDST